MEPKERIHFWNTEVIGVNTLICSLLIVATFVSGSEMLPQPWRFLVLAIFTFFCALAAGNEKQANNFYHNFQTFYAKGKR